MEKFIETTGKTMELAIEAALEQLHMDRDSVSVEILQQPRSGFLGIGAQPAKVKVTYEAPDEEPKPALSSASRNKPRKAESKPAETGKVIAPAAPAAPKPAEQRQNAQPVKAKTERPAKPERKEPKPETRKEPKPETRKEPKIEKTYAPAEPGSMEERIETFIRGLLEHMESDAIPHAFCKDEDSYGVDLVGENIGVLIGRRGETLDAIQHLANYSVNRGSQKRVRISVDAENYRLKREESLQRLAVKVAGKVTKFRRNITLEPMNAYERHVIHAALQEYPDVTTFSTGNEPNRRIVVAYSRFKNTEYEEK